MRHGQKAVRAREAEAEQHSVFRLSGAAFVRGFVSAGRNERFQSLPLPRRFALAAAALFLAAYLLYGEVLRENTYLSRTIEAQRGQTVIDTGLYGVVRRPMYAATILLVLSMPLLLGSLPPFVVFLAYPAITAKRIRNEEQVMENELEGYAAYKERVKHRIIPLVW